MADDDVGAAFTGHTTQLPLMDELLFRDWVSQNRVPFDPNAKSSDYDMRGFYRGLMQGDPRAKTAINPNDQKMHFPDYWKTPLHESFSNESKYATQGAPHWQGDQLVDENGKVLFDEKFNKALRGEE